MGAGRFTLEATMRKTTAVCALLVGVFATQPALGEAGRESLLEAWAAYVAGLPGTKEFEQVGDGNYRIDDTDLPYAGEIRIVGALVRPAETGGVQTGFSHFGMVDFELVELPVERFSSQSYYYWLSDRQTLYYSADEQRWVDPQSYQASLAESYDFGGSFGVLSFMLNYGIWVLLIALILFVFIGVNRQAKKSRALMDETAAINRQARENLDRAASMQDEVLAIARDSRDLQIESNELLRRLLDASQR